MSLEHKSKYIIRALMLLFCSGVWAQIGVGAMSTLGGLAAQKIVTDTTKVKKEKKVKRKLDFDHSIGLGVDLSKILRKYTESGYEGLEFIGNLRVSRNIFLSGEYGRERQYTKENSYDFKNDGSYFKVGLDYNFVERRYYLENMIYIGFRYAKSSFSQTLYNYKVFIRKDYWKEKERPGEDINLIKPKEIQYSWVELVLGFRALLFYNIYAGISARISMNLSSKGGDLFPAQWVPGYVKVVYKNNFSASFNYTISYRIPIMNHKKLMKKIRP